LIGAQFYVRVIIPEKCNSKA